MSNIVSRNVDDLPAASREGIEQILGAPLKPHERVYIVVDAPPAGPAEPIRLQAATRIRDIIAAAQANADAQGASSEDFDSAVDEAMQHIRPRS